jgi:hypothetical protein
MTSLLLLAALAQTPVQTTQPVQLLSGPSQEITVGQPRLAWSYVGRALAEAQGWRYELTVNGTASELVGVTCEAQGADVACSAPLPSVPADAKLTLRTYLVIDPPPAPAELRIIR